MKFTPLAIKGAFLIEMEPFRDIRGSFARQFCLKEFKAAGIDMEIKQCNLSYNNKAGTLRGMHFQKAPAPEPKIVSCIGGSCFDVIVDFRKDSQTYLKHLSFELSYNDNKLLYLPPYIAHGFQTLEDNTIIYYQLGAFFDAALYDGLRWNDPKLGIVWPQCENRIINERDANYALL